MKYKIAVNGEEFEVNLLQEENGSITFSHEDETYTVAVSHCFESDTTADVSKSNGASTANSLLSPIPGLVVSLSVKPGDEVQEGDTLLVLEAMKMENNIIANRSGIVDKLLVAVGDEVDAKQELILWR